MNLEAITRLSNDEVYARLLEAQVAVYRDSFLRFLPSLEGWSRARSVLDVGCGPGAVAAALTGLMAGKSYLGIDLNAVFVAEAEKRFQGNGDFRFACRNVFDPAETKFDVVLGFAVLQHLVETEKALVRFRELLNAGGTLVLFDASEHHRVEATPALTELSGMYAQLFAKRLQGQRNAHCLTEVEALAPGLGFRLARAIDAPALIRSQEEKVRYADYALLLCDLLIRFYAITTDRRRLLAELEGWLRLSDSQVALSDARWVVLFKPMQ